MGEPHAKEGCRTTSDVEGLHSLAPRRPASEFLKPIHLAMTKIDKLNWFRGIMRATFAALFLH